MKKAAVLVMVSVLLAGCMGNNHSLDEMMQLRSELLSGSCSFRAEITADYGEDIHTFGVYCEADNQGNVGFEITAPDSISGIQGVTAAEGGKLTFEELALAFPLLADDQISPVSAPYLLIKTLRSGYVRSAGEENGLTRVTIDDSYEEDALQLDIWLDEDHLPLRAEILYDGRRIVSMCLTDFRIS